MDSPALRAQFPVLDRLAYLNAGTCGPLPTPAVAAMAAALQAAAEHGRAADYFEQFLALAERQRAAYAALIAAQPGDVALTTSTSDGSVRVLHALALRPGDEILTAPDEHPGLLGPLAAARDRLGVTVRTAPFERLADEVGERTRLVACSHVSWSTGAVAPAALADLGDDVALLLDGAQGAGAVPVNTGALGCAFYAASGQKWLCGPVGTGFLYVAPRWRERLPPTGPTYLALADPASGLQASAHPDARGHDTPAIALETLAAAAAAFVVLAEAGWDAVHSRAVHLAEALAVELRSRGRRVAPRGPTTLVSFEEADPPATKARLAAQGIVIRDLPGTPYLRASVGAWNDETDLARLIAAL